MFTILHSRTFKSWSPGNTYMRHWYNSLLVQVVTSLLFWVMARVIELCWRPLGTIYRDNCHRNPKLSIRSVSLNYFSYNVRHSGKATIKQYPIVYGCVNAKPFKHWITVIINVCNCIYRKSTNFRCSTAWNITFISDESCSYVTLTPVTMCTHDD